MKLKRFRHLIAVACACASIAVVIAGCSSNNNQNSKTTVAPSAAAGAKSTPVPGTSNRQFAKAPPLTIDPNKGYLADIKTDHGDITVELNAKVAPLTVNNFVFLVQQHFYDGLTCHRVIPDFVAQCGDPKGDGSGGPGYSIPDEPGPLTHQIGAIAMAKSSAPNSAGSQFYLVLAPQPQLDGKYTVFGQVIKGMDVINQIRSRDPATPGPPGDRIISITISETDTTPTPVARPAATGSPAPTVRPAVSGSPASTPAR